MRRAEALSSWASAATLEWPGRTPFPATPSTYFWWDVENAPVLTIESGDTVVLDTQEVTDDQITPTSTAEALTALDEDRFYQLTGPILIDGAVPAARLAPAAVSDRRRRRG